MADDFEAKAREWYELELSRSETLWHRWDELDPEWRAILVRLHRAAHRAGQERMRERAIAVVMASGSAINYLIGRKLRDLPLEDA